MDTQLDTTETKSADMICEREPISAREIWVKQRGTSVLSHKKPAFRIILIALIVCVITGVCLLTYPKAKTNITFPEGSYRVSELLYDAPPFNFTETEDNAPQYFISGDTLNRNIADGGDSLKSSRTLIGKMEDFAVSQKKLR